MNVKFGPMRSPKRSKMEAFLDGVHGVVVVFLRTQIHICVRKIFLVLVWARTQNTHFSDT